MQDAARPVLLLQLLQQALEAAPQQKPAAVVQGSTLAQNVEDQAWPVDLANAICQQVGYFRSTCALQITDKLLQNRHPAVAAMYLLMMSGCTVSGMLCCMFKICKTSW